MATTRLAGESAKDFLARVKTQKTPNLGTVYYANNNQQNNAITSGAVVPTTKQMGITTPTKTPSSNVVNYNNLGGFLNSGNPNDLLTPKKDNTVPFQTQPLLNKQSVPVEPQPQAFDNVAFQNSMKQYIDQYMGNMPKLPEYTPYSGTLDPKIMETLNMINSKAQGGFNFDANNPALKVAQDQAMQRVNQDMAKRGRVFDTYASTQQQQTAQNLIPDFYRLQRGDYDQDIQNMTNSLNAIRNIDQTGYNRFNDAYGYNNNNALNSQKNYMNALDYGNQQSQNQFNRDVTQSNLTGQFQGQDTVAYQQQQRNNRMNDEEQMRAQEQQEFGVSLSPTMRNYRQQFLQVPQQDIARLMPYYNNLAGRINELRATEPNNPDIPLLESLRAMKVLSDPQLLTQYGTEYGMQSGAINQLAEGDKQQSILNELEIELSKIKNVEQYNSAQKILSEIDKLVAQTEETYANVDNKNQDTVNKQIEMLVDEQKFLQEKLKAENLPNEFKQKANESIALVNQRYASASASQASASKSYSGINVDNANVGLINEKKELTSKQTQNEITKGTEVKKGSNEYNELVSIAYNKLKPLSWEDAKKYFNENAGEIIKLVGVQGAEDVWNTVFADAIRVGKFPPYGKAEKEKEKEDPSAELIRKALGGG